MNELKMKDCNGVEVGVGSAVCVLTAGNFIFGHITEITEDKHAKVTPDIGYQTTKKNFRLKKEYVADSESIGIVNTPGDVVVNENCEEVEI